MVGNFTLVALGRKSVSLSAHRGIRRNSENIEPYNTKMMV